MITDIIQSLALPLLYPLTDGTEPYNPQPQDFTVSWSDDSAMEWPDGDPVEY